MKRQGRRREGERARLGVHGSERAGRVHVHKRARENEHTWAAESRETRCAHGNQRLLSSDGCTTHTRARTHTRFCTARLARLSASPARGYPRRITATHRAGTTSTLLGVRNRSFSVLALLAGTVLVAVLIAAGLRAAISVIILLVALSRHRDHVSLLPPLLLRRLLLPRRVASAAASSSPPSSSPSAFVRDTTTSSSTTVQHTYCHYYYRRPLAVVLPSSRRHVVLPSVRPSG